MRSRFTWLLLLAAGFALVPGCSVLPPPPAPPKQAVLEKLPRDIPQGNTMDTGLLVRLPEAEAIYDTTGMAYTAETYEVGYFSEYVWAEKPAQMIQGLLVGTLQRTHHFREVIVPPHFSSYGYVLNSRVLALSQDYTAKPPVLRAALRVQLVDTASNRVMATKDVATTEPIKERGPYGGVVAANEAIARILREIAQFTIEVTAPHGGER